jgi:hypothetical protein
VHSLSEPLHPRAVVWNVIALDLLHDVVILGMICSLVAIQEEKSESAGACSDSENEPTISMRNLGEDIQQARG